MARLQFLTCFMHASRIIVKVHLKCCITHTVGNPAKTVELKITLIVLILFCHGVHIVYISDCYLDLFRLVRFIILWYLSVFQFIVLFIVFRVMGHLARYKTKQKIPIQPN